MQFGATPEQDMIVETVRSFVEQEIYPLEDKIEKLGHVPKEIADNIKLKVKTLRQLIFRDIGHLRASRAYTFFYIEAVKANN